MSFEKRTRRWREQRWLLDAIIASAGAEFDQPRSLIYSAPAGFEALADFQLAAARIRKFSDMRREYASAARRREAKASAFESAARWVAARESFFIAAQLWACARWPIFEVNDLHREYDQRLTACYSRFAALSAHPVQRIEIPFGDSSLPAWLHLPRQPADGERFPLVVYVPGMDNNKEQMVAMYGERMLERGAAVLAMDGPGQSECVPRGLHVGHDSFAHAGKAILEWTASRRDLDARRIALRGVSFGSYFVLQMAAAMGEQCAGVVSAFVAHEPGLGTLFGQASPSFKVRFMMMSGYEDEANFDRFAAGFDPRPWGERLRSPILFLAGEDDELSPLEHTEALFARISSPKKLVVYEGHKHVLRGGGAVAMGENPDTLYADWLMDRFAGKPMASERVHVSLTGQSRSMSA
jgi:fermentation-respiration switch protein FrsA (DUF1100 family)